MNEEFSEKRRFVGMEGETLPSDPVSIGSNSFGVNDDSLANFRGGYMLSDGLNDGLAKLRLFPRHSTSISGGDFESKAELIDSGDCVTISGLSAAIDRCESGVFTAVSL